MENIFDELGKEFPLLTCFQLRSGRPVALELLGRGAWHRYNSGELADDEFYSADAQRCGLAGGDIRELQTA